jgi:MFS transporter, AAHS family, 4-hydroxybenzoate transporter
MTNVQSFLNAQGFSRSQWLIFATCFAIVLMDGFDTGAIGFVAPSLLSEWDIQRAALASVLSAALFGIACGALLAGPLSDWLGRRGPLIISVAIFGMAALASAFAMDLSQLTALRFLTGLGLGAALPNAVTIMSEFCPDGRRATLTNLMSCGFPLGTALGGFVAAWLIPHFGWRSVLLLGGVAPVLLVVWLYFTLPESVRYMVAKGYPSERINATLARVALKSVDVGATALRGRASVASRHEGVMVVLSRTYLLGSVMLWIAFFMGLVIIYGAVNWMPVLLRGSGLDSSRASLVSALFPLGGVGAALSGVLMDRFNAARVIAVCYALGAISIYFIGQTVGNIGLLIVTVFAAGVMMNTSQVSMNALAATFYPTTGRATGVAWMLGIGRFGGVAGSFLVAELSRRNLSFSEIFAVMAIAGLIACAALIVMQSSRPVSAIADFGASKSLVQ